MCQAPEESGFILRVVGAVGGFYVSHPSLPLSVPITRVLVQASLLSFGHFSGLLTSLATLGLCFFTVSELSSDFPMSEGTHV